MFLSLVIPGMVAGAIYSSIAAGVVLTYQSTGVFNFAQGAVAFVAAYLFYQLNTGQHWPVWLAGFVTVVLVAAAYSVSPGSGAIPSIGPRTDGGADRRHDRPFGGASSAGRLVRRDARRPSLVEKTGQPPRIRRAPRSFPGLGRTHHTPGTHSRMSSLTRTS